MRHLLAVIAVAIATLAPGALAVAAPDVAPDSPTSSTPTTIVVRPVPDIVPRPNSGSPPAEAGDRGGALQLGILAVVVALIGGAAANLVRQSRRVRAARDR